MRNLGVALLIMGLLAGGVYRWLQPGTEEVLVEIPSGLNASGTAQLLKKEGIIRSVTLFKIFAKLTGVDRKLKPGSYALRRPMAAPLAAWRLHEGKIQPIKVVIPEGFMARQIADRLEASGITSSALFMDYVRKNNLEGFLFPTTYLFAKGLPAESVAHSMHAEFKKVVEPAFASAGQNRFSLPQVMTLASIVQREARVMDEMPVISAVYRNRLTRRMRLEADPTVQYMLGKDTGEWLQGLRYKHLEEYSPYNTYRYPGLPPGPICSPGLEAVKAALYPADEPYLYFVAADDAGHHVFSTTYEEHTRNVARYRREVQKAGKK
ncbi:MAG: hypothetical protein A2X36_00720 [Elusimicrobia bacterium GWA2_69_24]|nr:MAG: hypothetical protein A2X36_00720 [Elusimicrobia bacterium GWA2_69_24]HBL15671.1 endolytic transglycosylase MltG [Elusimicrobiota bacterium]